MLKIPVKAVALLAGLLIMTRPELKEQGKNKKV